jgi:VIT1/CCC1 family predicted Fe2+/Mn2+ transporter
MSRPHDRVRDRTPADTQRRLDMQLEKRLRRLAGEGESVLQARLRTIDREWDTDRAIGVESAFTGLLGIALAARGRAPWRALPAVVAGVLIVQAVTGCHPLLRVLRARGVRSAREIARERAAIKALRGDFDDVEPLPA